MDLVMFLLTVGIIIFGLAMIRGMVSILSKKKKLIVCINRLEKFLWK